MKPQFFYAKDVSCLLFSWWERHGNWSLWLDPDNSLLAFGVCNDAVLIFRFFQGKKNYKYSFFSAKDFLFTFSLPIMMLLSLYCWSFKFWLIIWNWLILQIEILVSCKIYSRENLIIEIQTPRAWFVLN